MAKAIARRLAALTVRLDPPDTPARLNDGARVEPDGGASDAPSRRGLPAGKGAGGGSIDAVLTRLERVADRAGDELAELRRMHAMLATALDRVPSGVIVCNELGDIVERNDHAAVYIGARHGEALAEKALGDMLGQALQGIESRQTLELFGPPRRSLVIAAGPLHEGGRTIGALATVDDITEKRRLEAVRRDFVANISHELKTPVGALGLLAETLLDEPDPAVVKRLAERMQIEAVRVGRIIEDLLDLSRIEAEEAPRREAVTVSEVIGDALERARSAAELRKITFVVGVPLVDASIIGDNRQLVSAVANLLENAVKYSDPGSSVEVDARESGPGIGTGIGAGGVVNWVEVVVRDRGIGIPARDLERIFERFYRVDRARARDTGGTGLGLAIVRHVAGNHGGDVRVESKEGEGSVFTLRLPSAPAGAAFPTSVPSPAHAFEEPWRPDA